MRYGYCRVSSLDQSLNRQLDQLAAVGIPMARIYTEKTSGAKYKPVLADLLEGLKPGDQITVTSFDRLSRSTTELFAIVEYLESIEVDLVSLKENVDTSTPQGKLFFSISAAFAEFERAIIHERQAEGIAAAKSRGIKFGRPPVPEEEQQRIVRLYHENPDATLKTMTELTGRCVHTVRKVLFAHGVDIRPYVPKPPRRPPQRFAFASRDVLAKKPSDGKDKQLSLF